MDPLNRDLKTEEKLTKEHYVAILSSSMALIKQQCKIEWSKYGDDCTKLFMAKSKQHKMANYIYAINDSIGQLVEGFDNVGNVMYHFYQNLLGSQGYPTTKLDPKIIAQGPTLSMTHQMRLCMDFSDKDIKEVMFSIPNTKCPGPDGFSSGFFKST